MEAAILFESGAFRLMDRIVTVVTPLEERIERLVSGNRLSREQIIERIKNQIDDESRVKRSDFIISNSENDMIIPSIIGIHEEMLKLCNKAKLTDGTIWKVDRRRLGIRDGRTSRRSAWFSSRFNG